MTGTSGGRTPAFRIIKNGTDITANLEDRLIELEIVSTSGHGSSDTIALTFDDRDFRIESPTTDGADAATLQVSLGYLETGLIEVGTFQIYNATYLFPMPYSLKVTGTGMDMVSNVKAPVIVSHEDGTLGAIAQKIADAAGVRLAISSGLAGRAIAYLNQSESSMHLLQKLERDHGALAKFADGVLSVTELGSGQSQSGKTLQGFALTASDFAPGSFITESARSSYSKVRASYFDTDVNEMKWVTSSKGGSTTAPPFTVKRPFPTREQAQDRADAQMQALVRSMRQGSLILSQGRPEITGGVPIMVSDMRDGVNGSFMTETATHRLTKAEGLTSTLSVWSDGSDYSGNFVDQGLQVQGSP